MKLTAKQQMFVKEYLVDLNATQAAIRAGYSAKTARQIGEENLSKPDVAAAVKVEMDKRAQKTEITAEEVLKSIKRIAALAEASEEYGPALKGQELLGKHLKLFVDKIEHSGGISLNVVNEFQ